MRGAVLLRLAVVAGALVAAALYVSHETPPARANNPEEAQVVRRIVHYREENARWRRTMGLPPLAHAHGKRDLAATGPEYRRWVLSLWRRRALAARNRAQHPPRREAWMCIHRYEGAWNDPDPPYYGGLQMDLDFQRSYGAHLLRRKGTADNWTPLEQIWVAERAYRSGRGFYPWPNTARACGLI